MSTLVKLHRSLKNTNIAFRTSYARFSSSSASFSLVGWRLIEKDSIGIITLQSPATFNALTVEMGREFSSLIAKLTHDLRSGGQNVNAIVLTGQGDDAFSAGGNYEWLRSLRNNSVHENADLMWDFYHSFLCIRNLPVPVVAALHGPAIGAGAGLAMACDLRIAAPKKRILGFNFSRLGIHSGMGGSHLLEISLKGGSAIFNEILLMGRVLSGQEALHLGLVNRLDHDAKNAAYALAKEIATTQHPVAVRSILQTIRQRQNDGLEQALQREAYAQAVCYARNDWGEGVDAVAGKRDPKFDPYHSK